MVVTWPCSLVYWIAKSFCTCSQADAGPNNAVVVAKLSNVTGVRRGPKLATPMDADGEEKDSDDESSSDEEDNGIETPASSSKTPVLQVQSDGHCLNRSETRKWEMNRNRWKENWFQSLRMRKVLWLWTWMCAQAKMVAHQGCVNRIRAMPQQPHIVATWSDSGYVQVWYMSQWLSVFLDFVCGTQFIRKWLCHPSKSVSSWVGTIGPLWIKFTLV